MRGEVIKRDISFAMAMTCVCLLPVLPLYIHPVINLDKVTPSTISSMMERGLALFFLIAAIFMFGRHRRPLSHTFTLSDMFGEDCDGGIKNVSWPETFLIGLPFLPIVIHALLYTLNSYDSLFLGDSDFTNISEALNSTASGRGLLRTPFVITGEKGTFLGHHFSPALLLLVPFYTTALRFEGGIEALTGFVPTHLLYGFLLWIIFLFGLIVWIRVISLEVQNRRLSILTSAVIASAYPFWRLPFSFHFEILVLPLTGLLFLKERRNEKSFWIYLLLWLSVKEDIALYAFFYGVYLLLGFRSCRKGGGVMIVSAAYYLFVASGPIRHLIVGDGGADFSGYFDRNWDTERSLAPTMKMLFAFAFLPIISVRLFILAILPVCLSHVFSFHPWHATYYGHYIYTVLPFLLLGVVKGFNRINRYEVLLKNRPNYFRSLLVLSLILYAAAGDRENPPAFFPPSSKSAVVNSVLQSMPSGACVRTMIPFTPHVPLHASVLPIVIPERNPASAESYIKDLCERYYLFLDISSPETLHYSLEILQILKKEADRSMKPLWESGSLILYGKGGDL